MVLGNVGKGVGGVGGDGDTAGGKVEGKNDMSVAGRLADLLATCDATFDRVSPKFLLGMEAHLHRVGETDRAENREALNGLGHKGSWMARGVRGDVTWQRAYTIAGLHVALARGLPKIFSVYAGDKRLLVRWVFAGLADERTSERVSGYDVETPMRV